MLLDFFNHWLNLLLIWINQLFAVVVQMLCLTPYDPMSARPPCPSLYSRSCSDHVHWAWCHCLILSSSASPSHFAFILSQHQDLFQRVSSSYRSPSVGASASASVLPIIIQDWFPLGLTGLISLESKGLSRVLQHHNQLLEFKQQSLLDNIVSEKV